MFQKSCLTILQELKQGLLIMPVQKSGKAILIIANAIYGLWAVFYTNFVCYYLHLEEMICNRFTKRSIQGNTRKLGQYIQNIYLWFYLLCFSYLLSYDHLLLIFWLVISYRDNAKSIGKRM